jgi:hypothetical protein
LRCREYALGFSVSRMSKRCRAAAARFAGKRPQPENRLPHDGKEVGINDEGLRAHTLKRTLMSNSRTLPQGRHSEAERTYRPIGHVSDSR